MCGIDAERGWRDALDPWLGLAVNLSRGECAT
jgi:hypothetical protein